MQIGLFIPRRLVAPTLRLRLIIDKLIYIKYEADILRLLLMVEKQCKTNK